MRIRNTANGNGIYICIFLISLQLPHKHKIVIAGNHELSFDLAFQGMA
jgi:hypothetical protein